MFMRNVALPAAVLCLMFSACSVNDDGPRPQSAVGGSMDGPSLEGSWVVTTTPANGNCGQRFGMEQKVTVLKVVQAGNDFEFSMEDDCGNPIPGGTGSVDPGGVFSFSTVTTTPLIGSCTLQATETWSGAARMPADAFDGSRNLTVTDTCGGSNSCTVGGSFSAARCPASGCVVTCTP